MTENALPVENSAQDRLQRFWSGELPEHAPMVFRRRAIPYGSENVSMRTMSRAQRLDLQLGEIENKACIGDDYIPSLILDDSPYTLPSIFGCDTYLYNDLLVGKPVTESLEELAALDPHELVEQSSPAADEILETASYFAEQTGGQIPIHYGDPQGPFSVAASVLGSDIYTAIYDSPDLMRAFMDVVTETVILFYKKQLKAMAPAEAVPIHAMPYIWRPPGSGFSVSEDNLAVLSPAAFREFVVPCLSRIAEAFEGSLILHSCGDCTNQFQAIADIDWIQGFHLSQTPVDGMADWLAQNNKMIISYNDWQTEEQFYTYAEEMRKRGIAHFMQACSVGSEPSTLQGDLDTARMMLDGLRRHEAAIDCTPA